MRTCFPELDPYLPDQPPRGRRRVADDPRQRRRHIRVAYHRLVKRRSYRWIEARFGVCERTVQYWCRAVLDYDEPEAVAIQRHLDHRAAAVA